MLKFWLTSLKIFLNIGQVPRPKIMMALKYEVSANMQAVTTGIIAMLVLILSACVTNASKSFTVDVSPISIQYTPG